MIKLEDETGEFIYSDYGASGALIFVGNGDFADRSFNLVYNFDICKIKKLYRCGEIGYYVLTTPDKIINGLSQYYKAQLIINHEVMPTESIDKEENIKLEWDDALLDKMANKRAIYFWENKIIKRNLMMEKYRYGIGGFNEFKMPIFSVSNFAR